MRSRVRCVIGTLVVLAVVLAAIVLGAAYRGVIYIGADRPDPAVVAWFLSTTSDRSVARHAADVRVPPLDRPEMAREGFGYYREMCVECHGAPGRPASQAEVGKGLSPQPPNLAEPAGDLSPKELFWVTRHGISMSGMPAWGETHSDDKLWNIVAFVETLRHKKPEQYQALERSQPRGGGL